MSNRVSTKLIGKSLYASLTALILTCSFTHAQSVFNKTALSLEWSEDPDKVSEQITELNTAINGTLPQSLADFCFTIEPSPKSILALSDPLAPGDICTIAGSAKSKGYAPANGSFEIIAGSESFDYDSSEPHVLKIHAHARAMESKPDRKPRVISTLTVTFQLQNYDEAPIVRKGRDARIVKYIDVGDSLNVNVAQAFHDPEGGPLSLDKVKLCTSKGTSGGVSDDGGNQEDCASEEPYETRLHILSLSVRGTQFSISTRPEAFDSVGVFKGVISYDIQDQADNAFDGTPTVTIWIKRGVNNPPTFPGGSTGFTVVTNEQRIQSNSANAPAQQISPSPLGAWNATDLDNDSITYRLAGTQPTCGSTMIADTVPIGDMCIALADSQQLSLQGYFLDYESEALNANKALTIDLLASDGWDEVRIPIQITLNDINELYANDELEDAQTVLPKTVRLVSRYGETSMETGTRVLELDQYFTDPENDAIQYSAYANVNEEIVTLDEATKRLTIRGVGASAANPHVVDTVTVTATDGVNTVMRTIDIDIRHMNEPPRFEPAGVLAVAAFINENVPLNTPVSLLVQYHDPDSKTDEMSVVLDSSEFKAIIDPLWDGSTLCSVESAMCQRQLGCIAVVTQAPIDFERQAAYNLKLGLRDTWSRSDPQNDITLSIGVRDLNDAPQALADGVPDQEVSVRGSVTLDTSAYFTDEDTGGDRLIVNASSSHPNIASVVLRGASELTITGQATGTATITLTARDSGGLTASLTFLVTVSANAPPVPQADAFDDVLPPNRQLAIGKVYEMSLHGLFTDPDGDAIKVGVTSKAESIMLVVTTGSGENAKAVLVTRDTVGTVDLEFVATDTAGNSSKPVTYTIEVVKQVDDVEQPNRAPTLDRQAFDQILPPNNNLDLGKFFTMSLEGVFTDPDGDELTIDVSSSDPTIFRVIPVANSLSRRILARSLGTAELIVSATDTVNDPVEIRQTLQVIDPSTLRDNNPPVMDREALSAALPANNTMQQNEFFEFDLDEIFSDPDVGDRVVKLTGASDKPEILDVFVTSNNWLSAFALVSGETILTLVATDTHGAVTRVTERIVVTDVAASAVAFEPQTLDRSAPLTIDVSERILSKHVDPSRLTFRATVRDTSILTSSMVNAELTLQALKRGQTYVKLYVDGADGFKLQTAIPVKVINATPTVVGSISDQTATRVDPLAIDVSGVFTDADGDALTLSAQTSDKELLDVSLTDGILSIQGLAVGTSVITLTALDTSGAISETSFKMTIENIGPYVVDAIAPIHLQLGGEPHRASFETWFADDGDKLTFSIETDAPDVVQVELTDTHLIATPLTRGQARIAVKATDPYGLIASLPLQIQVGDDRLKAVGRKSLAGFGRAMLSSASATIGERALSRHNNDLAHDAWHPSLQDMTHVNADWGQVDPITQRWSGWDDPQMTSPSSAIHTGLRLPNAGFSFNLGSKNDAQPWSMWSNMDRQSYAGDRYRGHSSNAYFGMDKQTGQSWMVGLAAARFRGAADYAYGTATQRMQIDMGQIMPYVRYAPSDRTLVWGTIGIGQGDLRTSVVGASDTASTLTSRLGILSGRHLVTDTTRFNLAVRGDLAATSLATPHGDAASENLAIKVQRARAGFETEYSVDVTSHVKVTPFGQLDIRTDLGDGDTGSGFEFSGGLKLTHRALTVALIGRSFDSQGRSSYSEQGVALTATVNPSLDGTGFSARIAPQWGAHAHLTDAVWQEAANPIWISAPAQWIDNAQDTKNDQFDSRFGYGMPVANGHYLMTPFVQYGENHHRQYTLLGVELGQLKRSTSNLSSRFAIGRTNSLLDRSESTLEFGLQLSF